MELIPVDEVADLVRRLVAEELEARRGAAPPAQPFYSEEEFCRLVGISRSKARELRAAGTLPFSRAGRKAVYLREHVETFLKSRERNARR